MLPRRIHMHLPDKRLLVEGQADAAATGTEAKGGRSSSGSRKGFSWIRQKAMRTGGGQRVMLA